MLSYQPEEMIGLEWLVTVHPDDRENDSCLPTDANQRQVEVEAKRERKDSSVFDQQMVMVKTTNSSNLLGITAL